MKKYVALLFACIALFLSAQSALAATLTFSWVDNSNNEDGFQLRAKCAPATAFTNVGPAVAPNVATVQIVQQSNLICTYHVIAFNSAGPSGPSNEVVYNSFTVPTAPGNLQIQASAAISQAQGAVAALKDKARQQAQSRAVAQAGQAEQRLSGALGLVIKAEAQVQD